MIQIGLIGGVWFCAPPQNVFVFVFVFVENIINKQDIRGSAGNKMDRTCNTKCAIRKGFTPLEIEIPNRVSPVSDRGSYRVSKRFLTG